MRLPKIRNVRPLDGSRLEIEWSVGNTTVVDLRPLIERYAALAPLRTRRRFATVAVGEWGHGVTWGGDLDLGADTLWRCAQEQSAATVAPAELAAWRRRHGLSLAGAASALGVSRRAIADYESGARPIPKLVGLALRGYDASRAA